jgi:UDP-glucose 4-epimerase
MSNILVTGGKGFIGKKLVDCLIKRNNNVYVLDCVLDEAAKSEVTLIKEDIRSKTLDLQNYDLIYHLAAVLHPISKNLEETAWDINVNGTKNILERLGKKQHIIFSSSSHVYDLSRRDRHKEDEKLRPWNFYGLTKLVGEEMVEYYSRLNGFSAGILRFFNVYGPTEVNRNRGNIVSDVINKYKTQKVIDILNPGGEIDLIFIEDVIDLLVKGTEIQGTYNVGSGRSNRIGDIYQFVKAEVNTHPVENFRQDKEYSLISDIEKIETKLGWTAKTGLKEGIKKVLEERRR